MRWCTTPRPPTWVGAAPLLTARVWLVGSPCQHTLVTPPLDTPPQQLATLVVWHLLDRRSAGSRGLSPLVQSHTRPRLQLLASPLDWKRWCRAPASLAATPLAKPQLLTSATTRDDIAALMRHLMYVACLVHAGILLAVRCHVTHCGKLISVEAMLLQCHELA